MLKTMIIDSEVEKKARMLTCRFSLLKLIVQCNKHSQEEFSISIDSWLKWHELKKEFKKLLEDYDNGCKLNEELLIKIYDMKLTNNPIIVKRLIKLIRIR